MNEAPPELEPGPDAELEEESGKMSFLEHLDELRKRLLRIIIYVGVGFLSTFYFHQQIYWFLSVPAMKALPPGQKLVFTKITQPFSTYVWVSVLAGIFLTIPFILYEVWKFIAPGLYRREKRYVVPFLVSSVLLFLAGGAFCYLIVLPRAYTFLINFGGDFTPMLTIEDYLDITMTMLLGFGAMFEMPVIVGFLSIFGLVTAKFLWTKFKYAIVIIFIVAAVLSPTPDALNQCIYAGPMIVLYLVSIGVAAIFGWRRKKKGLV
jgi:sec-independent protein translocase protein TatC